MNLYPTICGKNLQKCQLDKIISNSSQQKKAPNGAFFVVFMLGFIYLSTFFCESTIRRTDRLLGHQ